MKKLSLLVLLLMAGGVWGSDSEGYTAVVSGRSCGEFIKLLEKLAGPNADVADTPSLMDYSHTLGWIAGYLSAVNWRTPDTYQILGKSEFKDAVTWLENYCRENPTNDVSRGMRALTLEFYPNRYKSKKEAGP